MKKKNLEFYFVARLLSHHFPQHQVPKCNFSNFQFSARFLFEASDRDISLHSQISMGSHLCEMSNLPHFSQYNRKFTFIEDFLRGANIVFILDWKNAEKRRRDTGC